MSKLQYGSLGTAVFLAAGIVTAFGSPTFAQDAPAAPATPAMPPQAVYSTENQATYAPQYAAPQYAAPQCRRSCCGGGPYKGFYPCNGHTPYCGGGCNVYGDAPIYTAPADYGHHCAFCRP
jgi:hypothetical protein